MRHLAGIQPLADPPSLAHRAEQHSLPNPGAIEPNAHQLDGVRTDPDDLAHTLAIGLGPAHQQAAVSLQFLHQIRDLQGHQF